VAPTPDFVSLHPGYAALVSRAQRNVERNGTVRCRPGTFRVCGDRSPQPSSSSNLPASWPEWCRPSGGYRVVIARRLARQRNSASAAGSASISRAADRNGFARRVSAGAGRAADDDVSLYASGSCSLQLAQSFPSNPKNLIFLPLPETLARSNALNPYFE
jgi:hypothetical protein